MTSEQLKNSILQFAVQGKLVSQNPHDEPASELLKKIKIEKVRLIKEKVIKKNKPSLPITEEEKPFEIPDSWEWIRLGEICELKSGNQYTYPVADKGVKYIKVGDMNLLGNESEILNATIFYENKSIKTNDLIPINSIIFPKRGGAIATNKRRKVLSEPILVDSNTMAVVPLKIISFNYFFHWFNSFDLSTLGNDGVIPQINNKDFTPLLFPLPPLAEQQRIVDKIDELLPLVEQYGTAELELRKLNNKFPEQLKKSVLQYAVQGKLVPQNPHDEPASLLLEKIKIEKKQLIKEKQIKQDKPLSKIKEDEIPFEIPDNWVWVRLGEIAEVCTGATPLTTNQEYYTGGNIPWITSGATGNLFVDKVDTFITAKAIKETNCKVYPIGTLIVAMYGQGKTRGQITELNTEAATNQACAAINLHLNDLNLRRYIKLLFQKIYAEIRELAYGGAQPNLNLSTIKETLIPLPPLSEQKKIVEKVEEVLSYCNKLK